MKVSYNCDYELEQCGLGGSEKANARLKSTKALKSVGISREQADSLEPDVLEYAMKKKGLPQSVIDTEMERKAEGGVETGQKPQRVVSQATKDSQAAGRELRSHSLALSASKVDSDEVFVRIAKESGVSQKTIDTVLRDRAAKGFTPPTTVGLRTASQQKSFVTNELKKIGMTRKEADSMPVSRLRETAQAKGLKPEALELMMRDRQKATS